MRINLSRRFTLSIGGILIIGLLAFLVADRRSSDTLIEEMALGEARKLSAAVLDQLHTSMRLGGGRAENRAVIERMKGIAGIEEIRVMHGDAVDAQYGMEHDEMPQDPLDRLALKGTASAGIERSDKGYRVARHVMPVFLTEDCRSCHVGKAGSVPGAISISVSLKDYEAIISTHNRRFVVWGGGILLAILLAVLLLVHRRFLYPLDKLREGAEALSEGRLDYRLALKTGDETQAVADAFDRMADSLHKATSSMKDVSEKYSRLVNTAADAILLRDLETRKFIEANPAASALLGYSREELLEMSPADLYAPEVLEEYRKAVTRWISVGKGYLHGLMVRRKDGSIVPVELAASILELEGRKYIQEIWRDVSERKGFEEKINTHVQELEETVKKRTAELNRSLRELVEAYGRLKISEQKLIQSAKLVSLGEMGAGIAHELNSPLAGILSITEVLMGRMSKEDPNYRLLDKIRDAAVRSKYIILDVLTYSRPTKAGFAPMFLNEAIRATLTIFTSEIKARSIEIIEDFDPELPKVFGNKGQVMEVVLNILKNGRDAMGGSGRVFISTRAVTEEKDRYSVAEFRDIGPGIADDVRDKIFDPFFTTKEKGGGHNIGLGLSISQSIIKEHGGRIEAENHPSGGAVFRIYLPVYKEA
ncbi:MAG: hypothetical protein A2054_05790 [Deltaproteobacteria bacterium GWA2_55_10]|nr:MAG: hypothetical protein A2054_05790 [Deltaproteobacteria bacterium GWA2_55_10]